MMKKGGVVESPYIGKRSAGAIDRNRLAFYGWVGLGYLLLWLIIDFSQYPAPLVPVFINNIWLAIYLVVINFLFFERTLPFARRKRRTVLINIFLFALAAVGQLALYSIGLYLWRNTGIALHLYTALKTFTTTKHAVTYIFPHGLVSVLVFGLAKHQYDYIQLKQFAQQLRIDKQEAELHYLRLQTNPHFLFNTLNNIYSLARDKSDLAPESLLRLSKILRFMLYETSGGDLPVENELNIIADYIALEKLRYDDSLQVNFSYRLPEIPERIPPLLLIPLVENAFKHGVSETRNNPFVDIHLVVQQRQLVFSVKNSAEASTEDPSEKETIGLPNLRRQLELLYQEYELTIQPGPATFTAVLKINLASHV
ncbi:histidine kinase [Hymenobacter sp. BT770]|uniref:sensor histidine kinase n=1 Tax=Hymenobacter sp. BT770 TaxID=2886942 RepID=UPI001D11FA4D|nr:histidine kinase [Hymenobacter sp. BT770]MCC3155240.1 histidine kinase [Hymenobacter sp. BT770]MDO3417196.1 histidine kinase [Hymenobacter sp. BT770]